MEFEFIQLTQDDKDEQHINYDTGYLSGADIGDWVFDDGEVLVSQSCVLDWLGCAVGDEKERCQKIYDQLTQLNGR